MRNVSQQHVHKTVSGPKKKFVSPYPSIERVLRIADGSTRSIEIYGDVRGAPRKSAHS